MTYLTPGPDVDEWIAREWDRLASLVPQDKAETTETPIEE